MPNPPMGKFSPVPRKSFCKNVVPYNSDSFKRCYSSISSRLISGFTVADQLTNCYSPNEAKQVHAMQGITTFLPTLWASCFASRLTCHIIFLCEWIIHKVGLPPTRFTEFIWTHRILYVIAIFLFVIQLVIILFSFQNYQFILKIYNHFIIIINKSRGGEATPTFILSFVCLYISLPFVLNHFR